MPRRNRMVLFNDPLLVGVPGHNPDSDIVAYYGSTEMFMSQKQAEELIRELSSMYPECVYRIVNLP